MSEQYIPVFWEISGEDITSMAFYGEDIYDCFFLIAKEREVANNNRL
jgi:hypothetical protein